jgi:hypothetical protein
MLDVRVRTRIARTPVLCSPHLDAELASDIAIVLLNVMKTMAADVGVVRRRDESGSDDRTAGDDADLFGKQAREAAMIGIRGPRKAHGPRQEASPTKRRAAGMPLATGGGDADQVARAVPAYVDS